MDENPVLREMDHAIGVLLVDDFAPWRGHLRSVLSQQRQFEILAEASDGLDAVRKAGELQPTLILLDIALPELNGIEAARRIRQCAPMAKILFLSENGDCDIATAGLSAGGHGYLLKSDCSSELLLAIRAILRGERFLGKFCKAPPLQNAGLRVSRFL